MTKKKVALVVAGGKGLRMNADIPKQFIELQHQPILMHTLRRFYEYDPAIKLLLVLPQTQIEYWNHLCQVYDFRLSHTIVEGGETRFHSVKNGLALVEENALVAVHDGVRPLVNVETIERCFEMADRKGSAIPVLDLIDSVRELSVDGSKAVDRTRYKLVQTPQVFESELLINAYRQGYSDLFTDDASVVESNGGFIYLVEGNRENIKITTSFDLLLADLLLKK